MFGPQSSRARVEVEPGVLGLNKVRRGNGGFSVKSEKCHAPSQKKHAYSQSYSASNPLRVRDPSTLRTANTRCSAIGSSGREWALRSPTFAESMETSFKRRIMVNTRVEVVLLEGLLRQTWSRSATIERNFLMDNWFAHRKYEQSCIPRQPTLAILSHFK